jgi:hypothetical protein
LVAWHFFWPYKVTKYCLYQQISFKKPFFLVGGNVTVYSEKLIWPPATKKVITKRKGGNAPKKEFKKVIFIFSFSFVKFLFIIKFKILHLFFQIRWRRLAWEAAAKVNSLENMKYKPGFKF